MHLGRVDFDLGVPPFWPNAQPLLPNSNQSRHNRADSGTLKIQDNRVGARADGTPFT